MGRVIGGSPFDRLGLLLEGAHFLETGHRLAVENHLKFEGPIRIVTMGVYGKKGSSHP
jgi:hypothetical protein